MVVVLVGSFEHDVWRLVTERWNVDVPLGSVYGTPHLGKPPSCCARSFDNVAWKKTWQAMNGMGAPVAFSTVSAPIMESPARSVRLGSSRVATGTSGRDDDAAPG
jgi:hypothetical protein